MKPTFILAILFACISFSFVSPIMPSKEKHYGKVSSILGEYEGDIYIKLNEENDEMIEIEMESVSEKSKGSKKKMSSSIKLNAAAIRSVVIDSVTYKIRNIEYKDGKFYKNCCIKEVSSNPKMSLYAWGTKTDANTYSLWIKGNTVSKVLKEISPITTMFLFLGCNEFRVKMREKQKGYYLDDKTDDEERLSTWKKWIEETRDCIKA